MNQSLTIKSWAEDDRPREKMLQKGKQSLSDAELIAILLGSGSRDKSAVELAKEILLFSGNNLSKFGSCSYAELIKFKGIGEAKAITLLAALELGKRRKEVELPKKMKITQSKDIFSFLSHRFLELKHEEFYILLLNRANEIIHTEQVSKGGVSGTVVDGKIIFKIALDHLASSIILCHNHPSGQLKPSNADLQLTSKMVEFGKMIDLPVLDHLIFTDNGYLSFADEGILN
jgi:DNA repair protein RadC